MADSEVRKRKAAAEKATTAEPKTKKSTKSSDEDDDEYSPWVDILRVITFLIFASFGLSYVVTGGESWTWGGVKPPPYLTTVWWKEQFNGPVYFTPEELAGYDGTDPDKPVYLAINGTVYDVSKGRHIYGPGGSYSFFGGTDASRAYVTGCFQDDITADMRGVETMYLPLDDPETDAHWTTAEMQKMRAEELENAKEKAYNALHHWVKFFGNSKKYSRVGYLKREPDWLEKLPIRELCAPAQKGRSKRKIPKA